MKDTIIYYGFDNIGTYQTNARYTGHKEYEIKDHLGNVRAVISDVKNPHNLSSSISSWTFTAEIRNLNNYYPYGMELPGGAYASIGNYTYGYNGMEKDDELKGSGKTYTTKFRQASTVEGNWWSRDPLEMSMPYQSPYILMDANPIRYTDPLGDAILYFNGWRAGSLVFNDTKYYTYDKHDYWGEIDDKFQKRLNDKKVYYFDGNKQIFSEASDRYGKGVHAAKNYLKAIDAGDVILSKDEPIYIVTHSMGDAMGAGFEHVMLDAGYNVVDHYSFAPKQPGEYVLSNKLKRVVQYSDDDDWIAPQSPLRIEGKKKGEGVELFEQPEGHANIITNGGGHTINSYDNIFQIPKGEKGGAFKNNNSKDSKKEK
ncbi:MAG: hypothetical protein H6615_09770 [Ignavibacteria bacterium]|nr:hypothetical protein [Ignavibacteria bacterium]